MVAFFAIGPFGALLGFGLQCLAGVVAATYGAVIGFYA